jgi:hypothetical protein
VKATAVIFAAIALLVAAVAAFAPATLADRRLSGATAGKLRIADADGTLWNGRGTLTDGSGTWRVPFAWTLDAPALFRGAALLTLRPVEGNAMPQGSVEITAGSARLKGLAADIPARALAGALQTRGALTLGGIVTVAAPSFEWNGERSSGTVSARWVNAHVAAAGNEADLGTVELSLAPQDARLSGRVVNSGGDVRIDGAVTLAPTTISVDATLAPTATAPAHIARALAALGTPDAGGKVRVTWRGSLQ